MPPIVSALFPLTMLIVALIAVIIVYMMWSGIDPNEFARLEAAPPTRRPASPSAPPPGIAAQPAQSQTAPAEASSSGGVIADIGGALSDMRSDMQKAKELRERDPMDQDAMFEMLAEEIPEFREAQAQSAPPSAPAPSPMPVDDGTVEVLRVLRNRKDGTLIVEVEGQRYASLGEMTDRLTGRRFLVNVRDLAAFARLDRIDVPNMPLSELLPPAPAKPKQPATPAASQWQGSTTPTAPQAEAEPEVTEDDLIPWEQMSIAQQIDRMLQTILPQHPDLARHNLRIMQAVDGGIRIIMGSTEYRSVDEVQDPEVKAVIQEAIELWEARS